MKDVWKLSVLHCATTIQNTRDIYYDNAMNNSKSE